MEMISMMIWISYILSFITMTFLQLNLWWTFNNLTSRQSNEPFECGFKNFNQKPYKNKSFKFINIALMYLIFDIEISLLTPILYQFYNLKFIISSWWLTTIMILTIFLFILTIYEFFKGNFHW